MDRTRAKDQKFVVITLREAHQEGLRCKEPTISSRIARAGTALY